MAIDPRQLQDLFLKLAQLPASERFLAFQQAGITDPAVWERLAELLAAHDAPGSSLGLRPAAECRPAAPEPTSASSDNASEQTFVPVSDADLASDESHLAAVQASAASSSRVTHEYVPHGEEGAVIGGRYVLQQKLGEGGMGEVWVARQTEPVKRRVALKLIRQGLDSKGVLQRFEHERQALALMDHPHIARVFDGGVTDAGQPYFVMELVNGLPLTKFCDELTLGIRERLQLFIPVCQAVQHAHQKGIIHRDLKPANILVTMVDGRPVAKVIDFGVAKATSGRLTEETLATQFGAVVGTLEYMAPEQAGYTTDDIDTRADLYSLGVILYELLTGLRPIDSKRLKQKALHEMIRVIREEEPSKPSTRLSTEEALPSLAALRQTEPKRLMALMRGELDWVVMKCLEKQRDRRYETANGLARDIERYLADEPVEARPPSAGYRLKKFLRRNRVTAVTTGLVLLALVGGIVGTTWGLFRAEQARDAEAARVKERDDALARMKEALRQEAEALEKEAARVDERDVALKVADQRLAELTYQRGIDKFLLARNAYETGNAALAQVHLSGIPTNQRGWESRYLRRQMEGLFTLFGHTDSVRSVAFSPDGTRIVTGSDDGAAKVWDAHTGTALLDLKGHSQAITSVDFSPDGTRIATGSFDRTAKVWDVQTGTLEFDLIGHAHFVYSVAFSPDGTRIVTGSEDRLAKVWDAHSGDALLDLKGHTSGVMGVAFSPDGKRIVTGSFDQSAKVWDAHTGTALLDLKGHTSNVASVGFSPDGTRIVTGSWDRTAKVWDAHTGNAQLNLKGHTYDVTSVAFSPDGTRIVTGSDDQTAKVWDANTGTALLDLKGHTSNVASVGFSPDGTRIVTGSWDRTAKVWDAQSGTANLDLKGHNYDVTSVAFSPDGTRIVTGSFDQTAKIWDVQTGTALVDLKGHTSCVTCVDYSPDGKRIVTGSFDQTAKIWDAYTGNALLDLKGHTSHVNSVAFSPDGTRIVTGSRDMTAKVWDAHTGTSLLDLKRRSSFVTIDLKGHSSFVTSVAFSPDGARIVSGSEDQTAKVWNAKNGSTLLELKAPDSRNVGFSPDGTRIVTAYGRTVTVWDAQTGAALLDLKGHTSDVTSVAFSSDATRIVTGSDDQTAKVWDAHTGTALLDLKGHSSEVTSVGFSPDGTRIVTGGRDQTATVWDTQSGTALLDLTGHNSRVTSVGYSPDGTRIVTGSLDPTAKVWDTRTGTSLLDLKGHTSHVTCVGFSPDGTRIVTGSSDQTAKIWDAQTGTALLELKGHTSDVTCVGFSPDGMRIVTGSFDQTAKIWDAQTGTALLDLKGHTSCVTCVSFSPDGLRVITGVSGGRKRTWDAQRGLPLPNDAFGTPMMNQWTSPDGRVIAHPIENDLQLVERVPSNESRKQRLQYLSRLPELYRKNFQRAYKAKDRFAMQFWRARLDAQNGRLADAQVAFSEALAQRDFAAGAGPFAIITETRRSDSSRQLKAAALLAWYLRMPEYATWCDVTLQETAATDDALLADRIAKAACLLPIDDEQRQVAVLNLARRALDLGKSHPLAHYLQMDLGIAEFRNAHIETALQQLESAARTDANDPVIIGTTALYRAMCLFHLDRPREARALLSKGAHYVKPFPEDEAVLFSDKVQDNDLVLWLAHREAVALLKSDRPPAPPRAEQTNR